MKLADVARLSRAARDDDRVARELAERRARRHLPEDLALLGARLAGQGGRPRRAHGVDDEARALEEAERDAVVAGLGSKRVIQRRFNLAVPRARVRETTLRLRDRSER